MPRPTIPILLFLLLAGLLAGCSLFDNGRTALERDEPLTDHPSDCEGELVLASIGDFGSSGAPEAAVAELVAGWQPDAVFTVGDNNYPNGAARTIDTNIGQYYHAFIHPYTGEYGPGADQNRFFPALGNHDWRTRAAQAHLDYFTLPGNERYYDVELGSVHLFVLSSDPKEPDGTTADSLQAAWFADAITQSSAPWKLVALHHPPFSSSAKHGSHPASQWPFAEWGATAVFAGHDHTYERLWIDDTPYFVNGLGGRSLYGMGDPLPESVVRYNLDYGALRIAASDTCLNVSFYSITDELIDSLTLTQ